MRHCGNCGASFDPDTLVDRTCPTCGAAINRTGDVVPGESVDFAREPTSHNSNVLGAASGLGDDFFSALPTSPIVADTSSHTIFTNTSDTRRLPGWPVRLLALAVLAIVLAGGSALLLRTTTGHLPPNLPFFGADSGRGSQETATAVASTATAQTIATNGSQSGPLPSPGASPTGSPGSGTPSPSASPSGTITPAPAESVTPGGIGSPALSVSPTNITITACLLSSTQFTVSNSGGGTMSWSASGSRPAYKISPPSGSLDGGRKQTVTVSNISVGGAITVTADGVHGSPQTVTINCTL
jgi:hypothetical protein